MGELDEQLGALAVDRVRARERPGRLEVLPPPDGDLVARELDVDPVRRGRAGFGQGREHLGRQVEWGGRLEEGEPVRVVVLRRRRVGGCSRRRSLLVAAAVAAGAAELLGRVGSELERRLLCLLGRLLRLLDADSILRPVLVRERLGLDLVVLGEPDVDGSRAERSGDVRLARADVVLEREERPVGLDGRLAQAVAVEVKLVVLEVVEHLARGAKRGRGGVSDGLGRGGSGGREADAP